MKESAQRCGFAGSAFFYIVTVGCHIVQMMHSEAILEHFSPLWYKVSPRGLQEHLGAFCEPTGA